MASPLCKRLAFAITSGVACLALAGLGVLPAGAAETVKFDLSSAYNVDLLGSEAERLEAIAYHAVNPNADYTLKDVFGDHCRMGSAPYDCYYVNTSYGLPVNGQVTTAYGGYQLGPAEVGVVATHQRSPNAVAFGKYFGDQTASATLTLPPAQRGHYSDVNFLLAHWYRATRNGAVADKRIRIWAEYEAGPAGLLYEGESLSWDAGEDATFAVGHLSSRHVSDSGSNPRQVTIDIGGRKLWEFRQALAVDSGRVLVGLRFEGTETESDVENLAVVFAGTGHRVAVDDPPITITVSKDADWCYQNTPQTTQDRHLVILTIGVVQPDPNGNISYSSQVRQTGGQGSVTVQPTANPLVWHVIGGRAAETAPGPVNLEITVTGNEHGGQGQAGESITVRPIGDIDGDGDIDAEDKAQMNRRMNSLPTAYPERCFDFTGDGIIDAGDKAALNRTLNSLVIP